MILKVLATLDYRARIFLSSHMEPVWRSDVRVRWQKHVFQNVGLFSQGQDGPVSHKSVVVFSTKMEGFPFERSNRRNGRDWGVVETTKCRDKPDQCVDRRIWLPSGKASHKFWRPKGNSVCRQHCVNICIKKVKESWSQFFYIAVILLLRLWSRWTQYRCYRRSKIKFQSFIWADSWIGLDMYDVLDILSFDIDDQFLSFPWQKATILTNWMHFVCHMTMQQYFINKSTSQW